MYTEVSYFFSEVGSSEEDLQRKWLEWVNLGYKSASGYKSGEELESVKIYISIHNIKYLHFSKKTLIDIMQSSPKIYMYLFQVNFVLSPEAKNIH